MTVKIASSISIWSIVFIVIAVVTGGIAVLLSKKKEGEDEREEPMPGPAKVIEKEIQSVKETNVVAEEKYKTNKISVEENVNGWRINWRLLCIKKSLIPILI